LNAAGCRKSLISDFSSTLAISILLFYYYCYNRIKTGMKS
jgi:hypothetical protein